MIDHNSHHLVLLAPDFVKNGAGIVIVQDPVETTGTPDFTMTEGLQRAFAYFNVALFQGKLPPTVITLQRSKTFAGYFLPNAFTHRKDAGTQAHEIAMNPEEFIGKEDKNILSTLVHEMVHHWQQLFGKPGKGAYHNEQWAEKMLEIGLQPISIDRPGQMTGRKLTHEVIPGDLFDEACDEYLTSGYYVPWETIKHVKRKKKRRPSKVAYACPLCETKVWGKPGLRVACRECDKTLTEQEIV